MVIIIVFWMVGVKEKIGEFYFFFVVFLLDFGMDCCYVIVVKIILVNVCLIGDYN